MNTEQILKVLKNERECIKRQGTAKCDRNCKECDLCLPDDEILKVYDFLIKGYELTEIPIKISKEESEALISLLTKSAVAVYPMPDNASYPTITVETDEYGRQHFNGICPYTNIKCEKWTCSVCEVEQRERRFAEGDTD